MSAGTLTIPGLSLSPDRSEHLVLEVVDYSGERREFLVREPMTGALFELSVTTEAYAAVLQCESPNPEDSSWPRSIATSALPLSMLLRVRSALEEQDARGREWVPF
jgi:hypothetical protein